MFRYRMKPCLGASAVIFLLWTLITVFQASLIPVSQEWLSPNDIRTQRLLNALHKEGLSNKNINLDPKQLQHILRVLPPRGSMLVWSRDANAMSWRKVTQHVVSINTETDANTTDIIPLNLVSLYTRWSRQRRQEPEEIGKSESFVRFILADLPSQIRLRSWDVLFVDEFPNPEDLCQIILLNRVIAKKSMQTKHTVHLFVRNFNETSVKTYSRKILKRNPAVITECVQCRPEDQYRTLADFVFSRQSFEDRLIPYGKATKRQLDPAVLARKFDKSRWIVLLQVNNGFYDFFLNWLYFYNKCQIGLNVNVVATDDIVEEKIIQLSKQYEWLNVTRSSVTVNATTHGFRTHGYNRIVSTRASELLRYLSAQTSVIYADVDTVFLSNPLPYFLSHIPVDMVLAVDGTKGGINPYYCTGLMVIVANPRTEAMVRKWHALMETPAINQPAFNDLLTYNSTVFHQPLPAALFPSGKNYFEEFNSSQQETAIVVHNNFLENHAEKKERFLAYSLWYEALLST